MMTYARKWALVTGASAGFGVEFARKLAKETCNLILVARRKDRLETLANELMQQYPIKVEVIAADLSQFNAAHDLYQAVKDKGLTLDLLINNAGCGAYGKFEDIDISQLEHVVSVNVYALTLLTSLFMKDIVQQKGGIINVASTAAFQPTPYMSVYGATKAYVVSFTEGLWAEYKNEGLSIVALCPGPVDTEFGEAMNSKAKPKLGKRDTIENVVVKGLAALKNKKLTIYPGPMRNFFLAQIPRFFPRKWVALIAAGVLRPREQ